MTPPTAGRMGCGRAWRGWLRDLGGFAVHVVESADPPPRHWRGGSGGARGAGGAADAGGRTRPRPCRRRHGGGGCRAQPRFPRWPYPRRVVGRARPPRAIAAAAWRGAAHRGDGGRAAAGPLRCRRALGPCGLPAAVLEGGTTAWAAAGGPLAADPQDPPIATAWTCTCAPMTATRGWRRRCALISIGNSG